jgi:hypothetical protein
MRGIELRFTWETAVGLGAAGSGIAGVLAILTGLFAFFNGDFAGAGLAFLAAAVAFGLLLNGLTRGGRS